MRNTVGSEERPVEDCWTRKPPEMAEIALKVLPFSV